MGKGSYIGGSTLIRPGSGWFSGEANKPGKQSDRSKTDRELTKFIHAVVRYVNKQGSAPTPSARLLSLFPHLNELETTEEYLNWLNSRAEARQEMAKFARKNARRKAIETKKRVQENKEKRRKERAGPRI